MDIFVGSLPYETTQEELTAAFSQYGEVANIKMLTDRETGRFRGIAFVTMNDVAQAQAAIKAINGSEMGGRTLKVEASQPREKREGGFGGRPRGGFGGGNRGGFGGGNRGGFGSKRY